MKVTNKNLKQSSNFSRTCFIIFACLFIIGAAMVVWGFVDASNRYENKYELLDVFAIDGNRADRIAEIDVLQISEAVAEDKYVSFYQAYDGRNVYLLGMEEDMYEDVCDEIEDEGEVHLTGTTLVVTDKQVLSDISGLKYIGDDIYLNVHEVTYLSVLKTRVQLIIGGVLAVVGLFGALGMNSDLRGYRKVTSVSGITLEMLDNEANSKDTICYPCDVMLTPSMLIAYRIGFFAFRYDEIKSISYLKKDPTNSNFRLIIKATDDKDYEIYRAGYSLDSVDIQRMANQVKKRNPNVVFETGLERNSEAEEDYDEDYEAEDSAEE